MAGSTNECGDAIVQCSMRTLSILFVFIAPAMAIEIELAGKSDREQQAREQLERVLAKYDTRKWTLRRESALRIGLYRTVIRS
jgi:hypothetical protein